MALRPPRGTPPTLRTSGLDIDLSYLNILMSYGIELTGLKLHHDLVLCSIRTDV